VEYWNWETTFTDIIGLYSTTVTYFASKAIEFREKRKIRTIVQILDTLRFSATLWGLGTTYDVHLGIIGKRAKDFLLVIIELFSLDVTPEVLRAKIDRKSAISLQRVSLTQNFR